MDEDTQERGRVKRHPDIIFPSFLYFRSLVMHVSLKNPGIGWPVKSQDTSKTCAWSTAKVTQAILCHFIDDNSELDRDSDLPMIT